jgi:hypothetical protein
MEQTKAFSSNDGRNSADGDRRPAVDNAWLYWIMGIVVVGALAWALMSNSRNDGVDQDRTSRSVPSQSIP